MEENNQNFPPSKPIIQNRNQPIEENIKKEGGLSEQSRTVLFACLGSFAFICGIVSIILMIIL